jgi:hypothetical protein
MKLRKWMREAFLTVALFVFAIMAWAVAAHYGTALYAPPDSVDTLREFAARMPEPQILAEIDRDPSVRYVWVGDVAPMLLLFPSGPSCYLFDDKSKLVRWDATTGDAEPTTPYVRRAYDGRRITLDEVRRLP